MNVANNFFKFQLGETKCLFFMNVIKASNFYSWLCTMKMFASVNAIEESVLVPWMYKTTYFS